MKTRSLNAYNHLKEHATANSQSVKFSPKPKHTSQLFYTLKKELYAQYDAQIVDSVFQQIADHHLTTLPDSEVLRVKLFCHYFDTERKAIKGIEQKKGPVYRVFKRYIHHTRSEMSKLLSHNHKGTPLTLDQIEQAKLNIAFFLLILPKLIEKYGENTCHKALNHYSILPSNVITGKLVIDDYERFCSSIDNVFARENELEEQISQMSYKELQENFDQLNHEILKLTDPLSIEELQRELYLKAGKVDQLIPLVAAKQIEAQAKLFEVSRQGTYWAEHQEKIEPLAQEVVQNINDVFFLKGDNENEQSVAVFKTQKDHGGEAGAMESLAYETSLIFSMSEALVPTKQKMLLGMPGSIQIFQNGMSWDQFAKLDIQKQKEIVDKISLKSFLQAGIASLLLGNRDLHTNNFFFVPKENDEYGIVVFDNEFSFQYSNYILTSYCKSSNEQTKNSRQYESILPVRCAITILPQSKMPIEGETKEWLKNIVNRWPQKFDEFLNYLNSPLGKQKLNNLHYKSLSRQQVEAFKERIEKLIDYMNRETVYSFNDLLMRLFPLYSAFFSLTEMMYPEQPEFYVGTKSAEYLSAKAVKKGFITEKSARDFLNYVYKHSDK